MGQGKRRNRRRFEKEKQVIERRKKLYQTVFSEPVYSALVEKAHGGDNLFANAITKDDKRSGLVARAVIKRKKEKRKRQERGAIEELE